MMEAVLEQTSDEFEPLDNTYYAKLSGTRYLYDHGLPFSKTLLPSVHALMERIRKKKASMIIIDGGVGEGKTTLAIHIADYLNIRYGNGQPVALDAAHVQLSLGGKDFQEKILICHDLKLVVLVYDEAGDLDKKTTLSKFNRELMRVFEMYRGFRILVIIALPRFYKLENELFDNGIPRMLLHTENRSERQGNWRAFDLEQMYYIKHHAAKIIVKPKCYDFGMPNFYGHFLDLPPDRSKMLDELSTANKRKEIKKIAHDVKGRYSLKMIAQHFDRTPRWVNSRLAELDDVGEVKIFEKAKWYDKSIIQKIEQLED